MSNNKRKASAIICDESNLHQPMPMSSKKLYQRSDSHVMNLLLLFFFSRKRVHHDHFAQDKSRQENDVRVANTTTTELEDAKDTEASKNNNVATGLAGRELKYKAYPHAADDDNVGDSSDDEIDDTIDEYFNRFPDELGIYERKGCAFMRHLQHYE